jgi:hypothetical protein
MVTIALIGNLGVGFEGFAESLLAGERSALALDLTTESGGGLD